jgi:hypothetical protein
VSVTDRIPTLEEATQLRVGVVASGVVSDTMSLVESAFTDVGSLEGYLEGLAEATFRESSDFRLALASGGVDALRERMRCWLAERLVKDAGGDPRLRSVLDAAGYGGHGGV